MTEIRKEIRNQSKADLIFISILLAIAASVLLRLRGMELQTQRWQIVVAAFLFCVVSAIWVRFTRNLPLVVLTDSTRSETESSGLKKQLGIMALLFIFTLVSVLPADAYVFLARL